MIKEIKTENTNLPAGWEIKTLEEVCERIFAGGDKPKEFSKFKTEKFTIPIYANGEKNKGLYGYTDEAKVLEPSITISGRGTIGYSEIRNEPFTPIVRLIVLKPKKEDVDIKFLKNVVSNLDFINSGSSIPQLTVPMVKGYTFSLPPLPQQKQIVAILDKAFATIDTAKANAEQNLQNANELRISITNNLFNSAGNSDLLTVDEITDFITDYVANGSFASLKKNVSYKSEKDYAMLLRLVDHSKKYQNPFVYVDKHAFDFLKKSTVYPNDIILSNVGARLGTAFRAPNLGIPMTLGPNSILIKAKEFGDYFFCWLQSAYGQNAIKSVVSGAGQPKFNKTQFKQIKVPIPKSQDDRDNIILKINQANNYLDKLESFYKQKLTDLEEMKKSILQKAFSGQLNTIN